MGVVSTMGGVFVGLYEERRKRNEEPRNSTLSHSICNNKFDHFKLEMLIS